MEQISLYWKESWFCGPKVAAHLKISLPTHVLEKEVILLLVSRQSVLPQLSTARENVPASSGRPDGHSNGTK